MSINTTITDKKYKKLSLQVSLTGLSFCVFDTLNHAVLSVKEVQFDRFHKATKIEELFADAFNNNPELKDLYDEILVIHNNNLSTFVPEPLFDEHFLGSYLQYNTKVFDTDFFAFDEISNYQMNAVYIPYVNINNFFIFAFSCSSGNILLHRYLRNFRIGISFGYDFLSYSLLCHLRHCLCFCDKQKK